MCILSLNRKYILLRSWYKSFESHRERNTLGLEERRRGERGGVGERRGEKGVERGREREGGGRGETGERERVCKCAWVSQKWSCFMVRKESSSFV